MSRSKSGMTRRTFLASSAAGAVVVGSGCMCCGRPVVSFGKVYEADTEVFGQKIKAGEKKLRLLKVGVNAMGANDTGSLKSTGRVIFTGMCDVDPKHLANHSKQFPGIPCWTDYRQMYKALDAGEIECDAVCVSTADHTHAIIALEAMRRGKHVYVQKPLAHSYEECEMLIEAAHKYGVVTQMGNQGHPGVWRYEKLWEKKFWGEDIKEVYTWTDRPWWPHGMTEKAKADAVPEGFNWDCWLGPAQEREYSNAYVPFKWRGWVDFGCGAIGDMAVHNFDPAYFVFHLGLPTKVIAHGDKANPWGGFPKKSTIDFTFPATDRVPHELVVHWSEAGQRPAASKISGAHPSADFGGNGCLVVGTERSTCGASHAGKPQCVALTGKDFGKETKEAQKLCNEILSDREDSKWRYGHYNEWVNACLAGQLDVCGSRFDYSARMTQALLIGCIAQFFPEEEFSFDPTKGEFVGANAAKANALLKGSQRDGFELRV